MGATTSPAVRIRAVALLVCLLIDSRKPSGCRVSTQKSRHSPGADTEFCSNFRTGCPRRKAPLLIDLKSLLPDAEARKLTTAC